MNRRRRLARGAGGGTSKFGGCLGYGFVGIFALVGLGTFIGLVVLPVWRIVDAQSWTETRCTITSSRVESASSDDGVTYRVAVRYVYQANGTTHTGDRYNWGSGSSSGQKGKQKVVDSMPEGSTVVCWYDPDSPADSVIRRGPGWYLLWGLFSLPFLAIGFGGLWFLIKAPALTRKAERLAGQAGISSSSIISTAPPARSLQIAPRVEPGRPVWPDHPPQAPDGSIDLEPKISRVTKLVGVLFFALVWNGILGVALYFILGESDDWIRFETLFFIPFGLVGLATLLFCVHQFLALFNPVPHLQLGTHRPEIGTRFQMQWHLTGSTGRLKSLVVRLEGRESATYRRGTNTKTDHHTFYEQDLLKLEPVRMSRGATEVLLPAPSLPTWESNNNKIRWRLVVKGDIPFWPDVSEAFPLEVAPPSHLARARLEKAPVRSTGDDPSVSGSVEIELDRAVYEPGEVVEGTVRWRSGGQQAESVRVSLLWLTEGKGTQDSETVAQSSVDAPGSTGEHRFALRLEEQPWSFSGTLISVLWVVEASLEPDGDLHRVFLTSAPGGEEVKV